MILLKGPKLEWKFNLEWEPLNRFGAVGGKKWIIAIVTEQKSNVEF